MARIMRRSLLATIPLATLVCLLSLWFLPGCTPTRIVENPAAWPASLGGRQLFTTTEAYIYAANVDDAREMNELVASVRHDLRAAGYTADGKPLIIARGPEDNALFGDAEQRFDASLASEWRIKRKGTPTDEQRAANWDEATRDVTKQGAPPEFVIDVLPVFCDQRLLTGPIGLTPVVARDAAAAVIVPTRELIRENFQKIAKAAMDHRDVPPLAQLAAGPILAIGEWVTVDIFAKSRQVALFETWLYENDPRGKDALDPIAARYRAKKLDTLESDELARLRRQADEADAALAADEPSED